MRAFFTRAVVVASALLMAATASAQTQGLERVGPTSPVNGFPTWYQDKTGITLEFCSPTNLLELEGGWCLLLPADTVAPEVFPTQFSDEHFFWAADAIIPGSATLPSGASLVLGLEAAFAVGPVIQGDQITFTRIRFKFDAPVAGTYTIRHPFGTDTAVAANAGDRIFVTEDIGITCQGNFECALHGRVGPFLLASNTPGGAELPAVAGPVAGKLYIADPARDGPVTGSPIGQNFFSITGPNGQVIAQTNNFTLMGRLFSSAMGGRVNVEKARYALASGATTGKVDVFASAFATSQPRLPGIPSVPAVTPLLGFYPSACAVGAGGVLQQPAGTEIPMFRSGSRYYGQMVGAIPAAVCVQDHTARDPNGQAVSSFTQATVADQVTIQQAVYDPNSGGSLFVQAFSSDQNVPPVLTASVGGPMANNAGVATVTASNIVVPPLMLTVSSAKGGHADLEVSTNLGQPTPPALPFAGNDAYLIDEDSPAQTLPVLANDTIGGLPITTAVTLNITHFPALGTAQVVGTGIVYTPALNAFGSDLILYTITDTASGAVSDQAAVAITLRNVNDAPVAFNDSDQGVAGIAYSRNLLANDTDPDGQADLVGVNILSAPAGVVYTITGGVLTFTAPAGTQTFTYQARDAAGALSNIATVSITMAGGETLAMSRVDYTANKRRWRIDGTSTVASTQRVFVMYADGVFADGTSAVGFLVSSTTATAGIWVVDLTLGGANDPRNPTSTLFLVRPTRVYAISDLGGNSPTQTINVR